MKSSLLLIIFLFVLLNVAKTQTIRYFEFVTQCGPGYWQDTSFIAAASDQAIIDTVLANITRPLLQRKFINGTIDHGHGGFNHNDGHWFLWHFVTNQWSLAEMAVEVCDGCPYSDVDADTAYWVGALGRFCPWSGRPAREIVFSGIKKQTFKNELIFYPVPANEQLTLIWMGENPVYVSIYNHFGQEIKTIVMNSQVETIELAQLKTGIYFLKIINDHKTEIKKFVVGKPANN